MGSKGRMSGSPFDALLMLADGSSDITATGTGEGVAIYETPVDGMTCKVVVPSAGGTSPTLTVEVQVADTDLDASYQTVAQSESIVAAGEYDIRFATQRAYVREKHTVGGTSPDFGAVQIGIVPHGF